jgi:hypothetical protein
LGAKEPRYRRVARSPRDLGSGNREVARSRWVSCLSEYLDFLEHVIEHCLNLICSQQDDDKKSDASAFMYNHSKLHSTSSCRKVCQTSIRLMPSLFPFYQTSPHRQDGSLLHPHLSNPDIASHLCSPSSSSIILLARDGEGPWPEPGKCKSKRTSNLQCYSLLNEAMGIFPAT